MLSRVANRLYWAARYLERSAGLSRVISAYTQFIMDTPKSAPVDWDVLIKIIDGESAYFSRYSKVTEHNVIKFLLSDEENLGSIKASVKSARENVRTTRDVLPEEAWELINELKLFVDINVEEAVKRRSRYDFLDGVMLQNLQIDGLFDSSMNRDRSFEFIRLGRYLERCDMATRAAAVGIASYSEGEQSADLDISVWSNILDSLSATSAYRRQIGPLVEAPEVVNFVFNGQDFPRSVRYCLDRVERVISNFKNNEACMKILARMQPRLDKFDAHRMNNKKIDKVIEQIQLDLHKLNAAIADTWFFPEVK